MNELNLINPNSSCCNTQRTVGVVSAGLPSLALLHLQQHLVETHLTVRTWDKVLKNFSRVVASRDPFPSGFLGSPSEDQGSSCRALIWLCEQLCCQISQQSLLLSLNLSYPYPDVPPLTTSPSAPSTPNSPRHVPSPILAVEEHTEHSGASKRLEAFPCDTGGRCLILLLYEGKNGHLEESSMLAAKPYQAI